MMIIQAFRRLKAEFIPNTHQKMLRRWRLDNADSLLRLDYDLNEDSLVFDLGGYKGQWTSDIFSRYLCRIHVFEPVQSYAKQIEERFKRNGRITVHNIGLGGRSRTERISVSEDASSLLADAAASEETQIADVAEWIREHKIDSIELMKINIEGAEYELLERLIDANMIRMIDNIQIQFHNCFADAEERMRRVQRGLSEAHHLTYQYEFVWENWARKKPRSMERT